MQATDFSLVLDGLPMAELARSGIRDLQEGRSRTLAALLLRIAAPRLHAAGIPELADYAQARDTHLESQVLQLLSAEDEPHQRFKALMGDLVSLENSAEARAARNRNPPAR